jgi:quercetin dioxygenase-like cupin family protein
MAEESWKPALLPLGRPGTRDVWAGPVYLSARQIERDGEPARRYLAAQRTAPLLGNGSGQIVALKFGPHGAIDEHSAAEDIVVLAFSGQGRSRVGGPGAPWVDLAAGEAVLWPAAVLHVLEAGPAGLEVRVVHLPTA